VSADRAASCLNCGAELHGRYCGTCGQRATPPFPTMREMLVDAWHELTVFDDRLLRTVSLLVRRPGRLTLDYLAGRRVTYVPPLRLYLVASVAFFLVGTMIPRVDAPRRTATLPGKDGVTIDLMRPEPLTEVQRAKAEESIARAPGFMRPLIRRAFYEPERLRRNMVEAFPRVLFVLVPVFAAIVAIFYWRPFSQHLVFALYLHAAAFATLAIPRLAHIFRSVTVAAVAEIVAVVFLLAYSQFSFRNVYGDSWPRVLAKSAGIAVFYAVAGILGILVAVAWAAWV